MALLLLWPCAAGAQTYPTPGSSCATANLWIESSTASLSGIQNFMFCNGSTWNSVINFQNSGKVGIGTTSPAYALDVQGTTGVRVMSTSGSTGVTLDTTSTGQQASVYINDDGIGKWQFGRDTDDSLIVYDEAASRTDLRFYSNGNLALMPSGGNVGIGTTSPNALLDIGNAAATLGTLRLESAVAGGYYAQIQPSGSATASIIYSLPPAGPASNGYVLSSTTAGVMSWVANGGGGNPSLSFQEQQAEIAALQAANDNLRRELTTIKAQTAAR